MGSGTQTNESSPWGPQAQRFRGLYDEADKLLNKELNYFPDSTIADRNPWEIQANQNVAGLVQGGSTGLESALAENQATTSGQYLNIDSNPWLREYGDAAASDISRSYSRTIAPQIASRFGGSGRSAGPQDSGQAEGNAMSASRRDLGQELSQMYAGLYGGAYENERGRMQGAVAQAPGLRQSQFSDQAALQAAGRDEFQYAQLQLSDLVNRFNFSQYEPYERLGLYQGLISQPGGFGTDKGSSTIGAQQIAGMTGSILGPAMGNFSGMAGGGAT
jgi:hypothetical protein